MTEPRQNDETKRRFEQLLAAKKAGRAGSATGPAKAQPAKPPPARADNTFRRRKV